MRIEDRVAGVLQAGKGLEENFRALRGGPSTDVAAVVQADADEVFGRRRIQQFEVFQRMGFAGVLMMKQVAYQFADRAILLGSIAIGVAVLKTNIPSHFCSLFFIVFVFRRHPLCPFRGRKDEGDNQQDDEAEDDQQKEECH